MRARRPVLPASVSLPPASGQLSGSRNLQDNRLVQDRTRIGGKDNSPSMLRMWSDDQAGSFSAATTPQGNSSAKFLSMDSSQASILKTLRWDASNEEFRLVKGTCTDARAHVPILDGWYHYWQSLLTPHMISPACVSMPTPPTLQNSSISLTA